MKKFLVFAVLLISILCWPQGISYPSTPINSSGGVGGFFGNGVISPFGNAAGTALVGSNNQVRFAKFTLNSTWKLSRVSYSIADTGTHNASFAIFDTTMIMAFLNSGAIVTTNGTTSGSTNLTAFTLPPGEYALLWTSDSTTTAHNALNGLSAGAGTVYNISATRVGTCSNTSTAGVLPSSCGTPSGALLNVPSIFWDQQ